jgi:hypothetical protein
MTYARIPSSIRIAGVPVPVLPVPKLRFQGEPTVALFDGGAFCFDPKADPAVAALTLRRTAVAVRESPTTVRRIRRLARHIAA